MNKTLGIVLVVIAIIATAGLFSPRVQTEVKEVFGANPAPTFLNHLEFKQNFTLGGNVVATTSDIATYSLAANEWRPEVSYVSWTPDLNLTLTTMASTSAPLSDLRAGESRQIYFYNASTTAAATVTFAAGTGVDLQEDEGGTVIVNGLEIARLTFLKKSDTDVILWVEVSQIGD